jgi:hypothetical protein
MSLIPFPIHILMRKSNRDPQPFVWIDGRPCPMGIARRRQSTTRFFAAGGDDLTPTRLRPGRPRSCRCRSYADHLRHQCLARHQALGALQQARDHARAALGCAAPSGSKRSRSVPRAKILRQLCHATCRRECGNHAHGYATAADERRCAPMSAIVARHGRPSPGGSSTAVAGRPVFRREDAHSYRTVRRTNDSLVGRS